MLHKFELTHEWLDRLGFPQLDNRNGFQVIKGVDFEKAYKAGTISFKEDGVYLKYDGQEYRGYMFMKSYLIERYGTRPRFHLTKCRTIREFIDRGSFEYYYEWSNSSVNDVIDRDSHSKYEDEVLELCSYCRRKIESEIESTQDFFESLDNIQLEEETVEVDIMGYTRGWNLISRNYRERMNYTCEKCGVKCEERRHRRFWHVHHRDGDKTNLSLRNLECLCVRCHSEVDSRHKENFTGPRLEHELRSFRRLYGREL